MNEFQNRLSIWKALSEFYLDTELVEEDYNSIFQILKASEKSLKALKEIDLYEVFPTLQKILHSVAGEWQGFDENWLVRECQKNYHRRNNILFRIITKVRNKNIYWMREKHWKEIERRFEN
ncbi:MAG: hypothetical protein KTR26_10575 [Flammeovirgaceae bacterium]|nr:hypothetical protein [Flammeovirgaceae bacterium]